MKSRTVVLTDISTRGCRATTPFEWNVGQHLVLKIPTLAALGGTVRWNAGDTIGLAFDKPLHPAVVDHVAVLGRAGGNIFASSSA